jgi:hypothetical protein
VIIIMTFIPDSGNPKGSKVRPATCKINQLTTA